MATVNISISDPSSFLLGLLFNIIEVRWRSLKPLLVEQGIDLTDPIFQRAAAEDVVDAVVRCFGSGRSAADVSNGREGLIDFVIEYMGAPDPKGPTLKLVP